MGGGFGRKSGEQRDEDSLRAKVCDALVARQRLNATEELPESVLALAPDRAQRRGRPKVVHSDQVGSGFASWKMTIEDAARLVFLDDAATAEPQKAAAEMSKAIDGNEQVQRADHARGNRHRQQMGFLRQVMHKTCARKARRIA